MMSDSHDEARLPRLIIVAGQPGSGKSTLARLLSRSIRCPVVSRDELKEGFINSGSAKAMPQDEISRLTFESFFEVIEFMLSRGITLIAEAAFQHKVWAPKLERLKSRAEVIIILCDVTPELAFERRAARAVSDPAREQFHKRTPLADYQAPDFDLPTMAVDTSEGYVPCLDQIRMFALGLGDSL